MDNINGDLSDGAGAHADGSQTQDSRALDSGIGKSSGRTAEKGMDMPQPDAAGRSKPILIVNKKIILLSLAILVIIIMGVYMRLGMFHFAGFFEPDGFFHFAVMRAAVANNYAIPRYANLSGFPAHNVITQVMGDYYVTLYPYMLLKPFGVSYYTVMRLIPVFFGVLDIIGVFFLAKYLSKSNALGLLAAFFIAISSGNISRTAALVYRGDGFISIFMILALILMIKVFYAESRRRKYAFAIAANLVLGFGMMIWTGAPYMTMVYIFSVLMITAYGFITANRRMLQDSAILSFALLITYMMQHMWMALDVIRNAEALSSLKFFIFYIPMLAFALFALYVINNRERTAAISMNAVRRAEVLAGVIIMAVIVIVAAFGSYLASIASGGGLIIANNALTQTIEELQHPSFAFLWGSFGFQLFLWIIGIAAYLLLAHKLGNREYKKFSKFSISVTPAFLAMLGYMIVTGYLQANAIRYNSLVSVPIAIFSAYAVYALGKVIFSYAKSTSVKKMWIKKMPYLYAGLITAILLESSVITAYSSYTSAPADGINSQFLQAMQWLNNNTPANATVAALWPDGSVVEGWGNRQSLMDSVVGQNGTLITQFNAFILNSTPDTQFLQKYKPQYLLARGYWYQELAGIAVEANIVNVTPYGFDMFSAMNASGNSTSRLYTFSQNSPPYYKAVLIINGTQVKDMRAAIGIGNSSFSYIRSVLLYNPNTSSSVFINSTKPALNYTLMVSYANSTITQAEVLGPKLAASNLLKFTLLCGYSACPYDSNGSIRMKMVYANNDSRIYKIYYNQSVNVSTNSSA